MRSLQLEKERREFGRAKRPVSRRLPKIDLLPRTLLTQITVPVEVSDRDCAGLRHDRECRDTNTDRQSNQQVASKPISFYGLG